MLIYRSNQTPKQNTQRKSFQNSNVLSQQNAPEVIICDVAAILPSNGIIIQEIGPRMLVVVRLYRN